MVKCITISIPDYVTYLIVSKKRLKNSTALVMVFLTLGRPKWLPVGRLGEKAGRVLPISGLS